MCIHYGVVKILSLLFLELVIVEGGSMLLILAIFIMGGGYYLSCMSFITLVNLVEKDATYKLDLLELL